MYYTIENYLKGRFDSTDRPLQFKAKNKEEYEIWKQALREKLKELIGLKKMQGCNLNPKQVSLEKMDGYTREKMVIQTEPGVFMPFYVLKPDAAEGERLPAVVAAHGHGSNAKNAVCGIDEDLNEISETIKSYNYTYGVELVKKGFIVFAPDARGFGERREKYKQGDEFLNKIACSCEHINAMAISLGMTVTGMWVWDLMRLTDYIETRDDVKKESIGACGLSGGGLQTLWFSAMDERVKVMVISGYFYGYKESLLEMHNCSCNYVPHLYQWVDIGDIGALLANRYPFIETGDRDHLNGKSGVQNVLPQVRTLMSAAVVCGMNNNVMHHIFSGGHRWDGEQAIPWLSEHLMG